MKEKQKPELKKVYEGKRKFVDIYGSVANMEIYKDNAGHYFTRVKVHKFAKDLGRAPTSPCPAWVPYDTLDDAVAEAEKFEKKYFK